MLANPSGEGFSTSGVLVSPSFSESLKSPLRESFVLGSCSLNHRAGVGWFRIVALCSATVEVSFDGL